MIVRAVLFLLCLLLVAAVQPVLADDAVPKEQLESLIATALAENPELKVSAARWELYRSRIAQASALDDPMLMLKLQNGVIRAPLDFARDGMTAKVLGVSQQLPFWGKRTLWGTMAEKEAEVYQWAVAERKLELTRMVKEVYYQMFLIDRSHAIAGRNIRIIDDLIALAETKYSVGQGGQQDIFRAQLERSRMLEIRISLEQQRKSLEANLNALLNRRAGTSVGLIADVEIRQLSVTVDQLAAIAEANRPLLQGGRTLVEKADVGLRLAKYASLPDFTVAFEYMQRDAAMGNTGDDMYSLGVTFNLPLQRARRQAARAEANAEAVMAAEELNSRKNAIRAEIAALLAQLERRWKLAELYKSGIIPQALRSLESAEIGYRVNKVAFLTLLDSKITLSNYEREYYESIADYQVKRAQLEALVGREL